ncbi:hypothetical protein LTR53_008184 [Teratosphaeriaceae sp. CCFEE 6253]|nr:hypothetical protein LTR53_008184 [Teratosphaeriaceae sp. CCFEE 6253]
MAPVLRPPSEPVTLKLALASSARTNGMCFVGYVYFACGHQRIIVQDCDIALAIDIPLFNRQLCENYRHKSETPKFACGVGGFYCGESRDGPFLDQLQTSAQSERCQLDRIDAKLAVVSTSAQKLTNVADAGGVPHFLRQNIREFQLGNREFHTLTQERQVLQQTLDQSHAIIQQARGYYSDLKKYLGDGGTGTYPPFVPSANLFGRIPAEITAARRAHKSLSDDSIPTHQPADQPVYQPHLPAISTSSTSHALHPRAQASLTRQSSHLANVQSMTSDDAQNLHADANRRYKQPQDMQPPNMTRRGQPQRRTAVRGRRSKPEDEDSADDEVDTVRRSARVRNKRISYAEDGPSDVTSREPSLDKSDVSGFSPFKSDDSVSPSRNGSKGKKVRTETSDVSEAVRHPSSLSERLNEMKRSRRGANSVATVQRRALPGVKDLLNSSPHEGGPTATALPPPSSAEADTPLLNRLPPMRSSADSAARMQLLPGPSSFYADLAQHDENPASTQSESSKAMLSLADQLLQPVSVSVPASDSRHPQTNGSARDWSISGPEGPTTRRSALLPQQPSAANVFTPQMQRFGPGSSAVAPGTFSFSFRKDSVTSHLRSSGSQTLDTATPSTYAGMRRSLSSGVTLTPTTAPSSAFEASEPKKRSAAALSPRADSVKRMRLSLPGEGTGSSTPHSTDWLLGRDRSEAAALAHGTHGDEHTHRLPKDYYSGFSTPTLPAPRFVPTAVMTAPKQGHGGEEDEEAGGTDALEQSGAHEHGAEVEDHGVHFSDQIDWGTAFEDADADIVE